MRLSMLNEEIRRYHSKPPEAKEEKAEQAKEEGKIIHYGKTLGGDYARLSAYCARTNAMAHWKCQMGWCECDCHDFTGYGG